MSLNEFLKKARVRKWTWAPLLILVIIVIGSLFVQNTKANSQVARPCSLTTLNGSYITAASGFYNPKEPAPGQPYPNVPFTGIHRETFDGAGNVESVGYFKWPPSFAIKNPSKLTYKVNPNCTGSKINPDGKTISYLVIASSGDEFYEIATGKGPLGPGVVRMTTGKRQ